MSTGHLRERPAGSGRWELRVALGTDAATGKRRVATATFTGSKKDAKRELARLIAEHAAGDNASPGRLTVAAWFSQWLAMIRPELSPNFSVG